MEKKEIYRWYFCVQKNANKEHREWKCVCICERERERERERQSAFECFSVICNDIRLYSCNSCFTRICKYVYYTIIWNTIIYSLNEIVLFCTPRVRAISLHPLKVSFWNSQNTAARYYKAVNRELFNRYFVLPRTIRQRVRAAISPSLDQFAGAQAAIFALRSIVNRYYRVTRVAHLSF